MVYGDDERPMVGGMYRPKNRRCCIVSVLSVTLALILVLAIAIPVGIRNSNKGNTSNGEVSAACAATSYPDRCQQELGTSDGSYTGMSKMALVAADTKVATLSNYTSDPDCVALFETARESLRIVYNATENGNYGDQMAACNDSQTYLSAAMENVNTCNLILSDLQSTELDQFNGVAADAMEILSIVLAITNAFCSYGPSVSEWKNVGLANLYDLFSGSTSGPAAGPPGGTRRLLDVEDSIDGRPQEIEFPYWMESATRRHLLGRPASYNVVVAADGSGKYRSVMAAINAIPKAWNYNKGRYIIYVKGGVYNEQIIIPKKQTNLMIVGDGIDVTIFTGNRNVALMKGMTTFASGTLIVGATGFIGKFFTVRNTAGSYGHQACAVRVSGDLAAFYQVKFDSYQDTLYAHTFRQFYTQCVIQGTVDFMFGNSQAVFQGCQLVAKKSSMLGQQNTYTAQGRFDPHQNTGLAFQDCSFVPTSDLMKNIVSYPTYLGRPWKAYSQTVLLRPTLQAHINPAGWLPWNTTNFGLYTSFFAEYRGKGPGCNTAKRVRWSHQITTSNVANRYQAASFINGQSWLPRYGLPYSLVKV